jgi:Zn-dependent protease
MTFRLGNIPVRVHGSFWLTLALLGSLTITRPVDFALWMAIAFVSILIHELGHALAGRAFGLVPRIDLLALGGNTSFVRGGALTPWKAIALYLAGPLPGIALGAAIQFAARLYLTDLSPVWLVTAARDAVWVNVGWGVFNLLPVLPLDGGHIMVAILALCRVKNAERVGRIASIVLGIVFALVSFRAGVHFGTALMLLFAWRSYQGLATVKLIEEERELAQKLAAAREALAEREGRRIIEVAEPIAHTARTAEVRGEALRLLAYGRLLEGHWAALMKLVEEDGFEIGIEALGKLKIAADELGRTDEAERIARVVQSTQFATAR